MALLFQVHSIAEGLIFAFTAAAQSNTIADFIDSASGGDKTSFGIAQLSATLSLKVGYIPGDDIIEAVLSWLVLAGGVLFLVIP